MENVLDNFAVVICETVSAPFMCKDSKNRHNEGARVLWLVCIEMLGGGNQPRTADCRQLPV
jgi:hypothetical protein